MVWCTYHPENGGMGLIWVRERENRRERLFGLNSVKLMSAFWADSSDYFFTECEILFAWVD
jgi:hypothetical protein